jgi:hypothetical protein
MKRMKGFVCFRGKGCLETCTRSYGRLQDEGHVGVHVVVAHVERQQAPAFTDGVEDDWTTVLAKAVAPDPQLLNDLCVVSEPKKSIRRVYPCFVQGTLLARIASIKQIAASNFTSLLPLMLVHSCVPWRPSSCSDNDEIMAAANAAPTTPLKTLALASMVVLPTSSTLRGRPSLTVRAIRIPELDVKRQFLRMRRRMEICVLNICKRDSTAESLI